MKTLAKTAVHALWALGLAGAPAFAQDRDHRTVSVSAAGIDLGTAAGQKIFDQRIEKALRNVCRTTSHETGTRINNDALKCLADARADAKRQLAAPGTNGQRGG